jgi:hypothetical protein
MTNEWKGRPTDPAWWRKLNNASDALALATDGAWLKLTLGECASLQTFPEGYPFAGGVESRYRQVGNAVPPSLAAAVARAVRAAEEGAVTIRETLPAVAELAERVFAAAVALVRGRPPRGINPDDIDAFVSRHAARLRALIVAATSRRPGSGTRPGPSAQLLADGPGSRRSPRRREVRAPPAAVGRRR